MAKQERHTQFCTCDVVAHVRASAEATVLADNQDQALTGNPVIDEAIRYAHAQQMVPGVAFRIAIHVAVQHPEWARVFAAASVRAGAAMYGAVAEVVEREIAENVEHLVAEFPVSGLGPCRGTEG